MGEKIYGDAGNRVVLEERLTGEEVSLLAVTDGRPSFCWRPRTTNGPARVTRAPTGGIGAYAPASVLTPELLAAATTRIPEPVTGDNKKVTPILGSLRRLMLTKRPGRWSLMSASATRTQVILPYSKPREVIRRFAGRLAEILSWRGRPLTSGLRGYPVPTRPAARSPALKKANLRTS